MNVVIVLALTLVLAGAALVVFTGRPSRQAVLLGVYGLLLTILFMALAAPDVALSQLAIGTAVVPLIVTLSIRKIASVRAAHHDGHAEADADRSEGGDPR
jgi:Predicted subunit of the Multisubunit Na+/H+ antiporter